MARLLESYLRSWLRAAVDVRGALSFVEAAAGGTVGVPDVFVSVDAGVCRSQRLPGNGEGFLLPLELKIVEAGKGSGSAQSFRFRSIKPEQINWHEAQAKLGIRTAFLVAIDRGGKQGVTVGLVPGKHARALAKGAPASAFGIRTIAKQIDNIVLTAMGDDFAPNSLSKAPENAPKIAKKVPSKTGKRVAKSRA